MRHHRKTIKLGRSQAHRDALLANLAVSLIEHNRIKTTLAKAKAVRPFVEKLVTKAKKNTLHTRRMALADLTHNEKAVRALFSEVGPRCAAREGGYTRIIKLGARMSDSAPMAFLEWVDGPAVVEPAAEPKTAKKKAKKAAPKSEEKAAKPKKEAKKADADEEKPAHKPRAKKAPPKDKGK
jgi:large subunit ribosomal protein L17